MVAIQIWCAVFALTCVVQVTNAGNVAYGVTCTTADTCTEPGTACLALTIGGALTCICDSSKYMVKASGANTCECMAGYTGTAATSCKGNVGSTCALNAECLSNGYCGSDKKCACSPTHTGASGATTCAAKAITGTCTATGGECSAIANSYCNTGVTAPACTCATIFPTGSSCTAKVCTSGGTECSSVDANSACVGVACACKANYGIFSLGTKATCQPGVGAACTASGGECANLPGGYCNTAVCACGVVYTAGSGTAAATCIPKACEPGSTTCSLLDGNSECGKGYCVCKSGTMGSAGKCTASGALKVVTSMLLLAANLMAAILM